MKFGKKGASVPFLTMWVIVLVMVAGLATLYVAKKTDLLGSIIVTTGAGGTGGTGGTGDGGAIDTIKCDGTANIQFRYVNTLDDTVVGGSFQTATGYVYLSGSDSLIQTVANDTNYAAGCDGTYVIKVPSSATLTGGDVTIGPVKRGEAKNYQGKEYDLTKARVFDNTNNAFLYVNASSGSTTYTQTGYENSNVTVCNASSEAIPTAADTTYTYTVYLKAQTSTEQWGDGQSAVCVDYISTELDMPALKVNGKVMGESDVYASGNIQGLLSGANSKAKCYKIGPIMGKSDTVVEVSFTSLSGTNPSSDLTLHFITEGYYQSIDGNNFKWGIQKDDPSQTWVHADNKVTFNLT